MAGWDTVDLFAKFKLYLGRGNGGVMVADELFTDQRMYELLADAQEQVYGDLAPRVPWVFVSIPTLMETFDGGVTYEIPKWMFGHAEIYATEKGGRQLYATNYGDYANPDGFVFEGFRIRMPGNQPRQFAAGPWARYVGHPGRISATRQPDMYPDQARELILWKALELGAGISQAMMDPAPWAAKYKEARIRWLELFKTAYSAPQGAEDRRAWSWQLSLSQL